MPDWTENVDPEPAEEDGRYYPSASLTENTDGLEAASWTGHEKQKPTKSWKSSARRAGQDHDAGKQFRQLRLLTPTACADSPPRGYVVKGIIAPGDMGLCFGHPGCGKSVLCPHIGYAVAQGRSIFGKRVRQGLVFYIPAEDPHGMRQRIHALRLEHGDTDQFVLIEGIGDLLTQDGQDRQALLDLVARDRPALVIVDTIAAAFPALRENEAEDMGRVVALAREIAEYGPAIILAHHSPKTSDSTPRGHGNLNGDADVALNLSPEADSGTVIVRLTKNRNGASGTAFSFSIKGLRIGVDEDGDSITAPIAQEISTGSAVRTHFTKTEATALRFLADLLVAKGKPLPIGPDYPMLLGVLESDWRIVCESRRLSTAEVETDRSRVFRRAYATLLEKQAVAVREGVVWLTYPDRTDNPGQS